nr:RNA polymerase II-associated protein 3 [Polyrhizophydium stewartii]
MEAALRVRRNAEEYRESVSDLLSWEKQMQKQDTAAKKAHARTGGMRMPPVRARGDIATAAAAEAASQATSAAAAAPAAKPGQPKLKSWDYRAWDKFDVDKALEEIDYGASEKPSTQPAEPSTFVNDEAVEEDEVNRIEEALVEKEKGNEYFKRKDFKKAVACYTKSFKLNPDDVTPVVNRALAYLKMKRWTEAESDCTHGLSMQPKNVKALWRRGIARRELGKLEEAMAAVLEPTNASVKEELNAVEKSIEAKLVPGVPKTMYEFERDWKSLKNDNAGLYAYLRAIPAASLPRIFQRSLESHYVSKMLEIMSEFYIENDSRRVLCDAMIAMTRIERFSMATMFLSKSDKQAAANLVAHLAADGSDIPAGEIEQIKKAFKVK